eukprot:TRINITY_DN8396_c0_g1_i1.p1 TRINITY_DN8396_c0_g1~~TRINITY_DN8396_c0_g1_i1.p1  ORF type:complete len:294 (+),score=48.05 TRINITY_DN8396_c0_g1_i1:35-883(+)
MSMHGTEGRPEWAEPRMVVECKEEARPGYNSMDASEYLDTADVLKEKVKVLADMIRKSKGVVVYTGAGISTAGGMPDYASRATSSVAPHRRAGGEGSTNRLELSPTFSHHVVAAMEQHGHVQHWLQQNHDRLAQKAGFPQSKLNEIHGAWGDDKNQVKMMADTLRPDLLEWALHWAQYADLCIAMGTSLCGMTSDTIAQEVAHRHSQGTGQGLVIINLQRTASDGDAALRLWGTLDNVLGLLAKELKIKVPNKVAMGKGASWVRDHPRCKYNTPKRRGGDPM